MKTLLFILISWTALGVESAVVESKVQSDLEKALTRMIPEDQFVVQVKAETKQKEERRLVEGESLQGAMLEEEPNVKVPPMPGFIPDTADKPRKQTPQSRQVYRMEEISILSFVRVSLTFDEALDATKKQKAKEYTTNYLRSNYAGISSAVFLQIPMLKKESPKVAEELTPTRKLASIEEPKPEDPLKKYAVYGVLGFLGLISLLLTLNLFLGKGSPAGKSDNIINFPQMGAKQRESETVTTARPPSSEVVPHRKLLLDKFLSHPAAFRQYYGRLQDETRSELAGAIAGPAFDSLLDSLHLESVAAKSGGDAGSVLTHHLAEFSEFCQTQDWASRQFFGFLHELREDQLNQLVARENPRTIALMLRFMKPGQSAVVLESISREKRLDVVSQASDVIHMSWGEMVHIEKELRSLVQRLALEGTHTPKDEVTFWGSVISESADQEGILKDIEHSMPEMAPHLKKFRFRLEDAATLPDSILEQVLSDVDNDELCLALRTCTNDVAEVLMAGVSPRRQAVLKAKLPALREVPLETQERARVRLTKRFREALV